MTEKDKSINMIVPKGFGGKDGQKELEKILSGEGADGKTGAAQTVKSNIGAEKTIYCPTNKLYFRTQLTNVGENWYETHLSLYNTGWRMPSLLEFMQLIRSIADSPGNEGEEFFNSVFDSRTNPKQSIWMDTRFIKINGQIKFGTHHLPDASVLPIGSHYKIGNGGVVDDCYRSIYAASLFEFNSENGLPHKFSGLNMAQSIMFRGPEDGKVAIINRNLRESAIDCSVSPHEKETTRGVYACRR